MLDVVVVDSCRGTINRSKLLKGYKIIVRIIYRDSIRGEDYGKTGKTSNDEETSVNQ